MVMGFEYVVDYGLWDRLGDCRCGFRWWWISGGFFI